MRSTLKQAAEKPLLEVKNLAISLFTPSGAAFAVQDLSFEVKKGESVAIVGESGCGKTLTAFSLMGLIPKKQAAVSADHILFQDQDLLKLSALEMRKIRGKEMAMIFQDPSTALNPTMKVGKQITESIRYHLQVSFSEAKRQALDLLQEVGIPDPEIRFHQYPHEFSGGMRQRVLIAIALACRPKLLIADEPTTALDVTIQAQIHELLKKIQRSREMSVILITHDLGIVAGMCDRVFVMYAGRLVEVANVENLYASPFHPYTKGLLKSIPRLDMDRKASLVAIPGSPLL